MSDTTLARKAAAVVKLVTKMDKMACENVADRRCSVVQVGCSDLTCCHAS